MQLLRVPEYRCRQQLVIRCYIVRFPFHLYDGWHYITILQYTFLLIEIPIRFFKCLYLMHSGVTILPRTISPTELLSMREGVPLPLFTLPFSSLATSL